MDTNTLFSEFKEKLQTLIGELKVEARLKKHSLAKFLCNLLVRALSAPDAKRFTFDADIKRNEKAVLTDQSRNQKDLDYYLHSIKSCIDFYLERCDDFSAWERASLATCSILVYYFEKKILHVTTVRVLFSIMTAKAKMESRGEKKKKKK
jgi:hypothetical protein